MGYFAVLLNLPLEPELLLNPDRSQEPVPWCPILWGEGNWESYSSLKGREGGGKAEEFAASSVL